MKVARDSRTRFTIRTNRGEIRGSAEINPEGEVFFRDSPFNSARQSRLAENTLRIYIEHQLSRWKRLASRLTLPPLPMEEEIVAAARERARTLGTDPDEEIRIVKEYYK